MAGEVYVWGSGECDQLGVDLDDEQFKNIEDMQALVPVQLPLQCLVKAICCGSFHSAVLTDAGTLLTWGCNDDNALGREGNEKLPGEVPQLRDVVQMAAGDSHMIVLTAQNELYMWGTYRNSSGNITTGLNTPTRIGKSEFSRTRKITRICSGAHHSLVLADGKVYAWGDSEKGQLARRPCPRRRALTGLTIESTGLKDVKEIFCGKDHNFAIKHNGKVLAWGLNESGQLGIGSDQTQFSPVEVRGLRGHKLSLIRGGEGFSLALTADKTLLAWGTNNYGQLGFGDSRERWIPEQVPSLSNVMSIECGGNYSFAILEDSRVFSWGMGMNYVLCNGDEEDILEPRLVEWFTNKSLRQLAPGAQHAIALL
mmetsp:Transcript_23882/g.42273  ORF Transcript_23882/g.42273 Transcript_23882/m.42273 type:complete len:368 (+) Transcript_23882:2665-3768(+)